MSNINIPDDLVEDILLLLPAKSLLRFRRVSKSWRNLISSQGFIRKQLFYSQGNITNHSIYRSMTDGRCLHSADCDDNADSLLETNFSTSFDRLKLNAPLKIPSLLKIRNPDVLKREFRVVGSCNGLLCLRKYAELFVFWNPTTRMHRELLNNPLASDFHHDSFPAFGFGYDCLNDDYKLVLIVDRKFEYETMVYSLNSCSWRRIQDFPGSFRYTRSCVPSHGTFASGALHWFADSRSTSRKDQVIVALDLVTEEYRILPQPRHFRRLHDPGTSNLEALGGHLCVVSRFTGFNRVEIWMMKDYGVKESWQNIISINRMSTFFCHCEEVRPLTYSKCGKLVLLGHCDRLVWFDLEKQSIVNDALHPCSTKWFNLNMFVPSLVSKDGFRKDADCYEGHEIQNRRVRKSSRQLLKRKRELMQVARWLICPGFMT